MTAGPRCARCDGLLGDAPARTVPGLCSGLVVVHDRCPAFAVLATVGAIADRAMAQPIGAPVVYRGPLQTVAEAIEDVRERGAGADLLEASKVSLDATGVHILCPASATFDAAEALRLELVAKVPTGVAVDVQIAPSLPGELSAEDEAGERLHVAERAARLAPVRLEVDEEPFPWDE